MKYMVVIQQVGNPDDCVYIDRTGRARREATHAATFPKWKADVIASRVRASDFFTKSPVPIEAKVRPTSARL